MYDCETVLLLLNVKGNMKNRNMFKICFSYISFSDCEEGSFITF